jgi:transcriptional regulator with XRE-family HTH domain
MTMTAPPVGELLRDWRQRRRMSQLDLSVEASVSTRHLSFVETGRSKPSRELVLHLAEHLEVPLRERNRVLLAAGFAPAFEARPLDDERMAPVRSALDKILSSHEPFPAVIVDRGWDLVAANDSALRVLTEDVAPQLLDGRINALRVSLHPDGMAPRIVNFAEWSEHLMTRLHRQATASGDPALFALHEELRAYPGVVDEPARPHDVASLLFVPLVLRWRGDELRFFSTLATFGTALDVTIAELAIESFFPADEATAGRMSG